MIYGKGLISRLTLAQLRTVIALITGDNKTKLTPMEMVDKIHPLFEEKNKVIQGILDRNITSIDLEACGINSLGEYALANCRELRSIKIPYSVSQIDETAFKGSWIKSIEVDMPYNTLYGAPWGADMAKGDVVWLQAEKLPVTLVQSPHQTIVATVDGKEFTSSFEYYRGATISFKAVADDGYAPGEVSITEGYLESPLTVSVTDAIEMQVSRRLEFPNPSDGPEDGWLFGGLILDSGDKFYFKYRISGYIEPDGDWTYYGHLTLEITYPYTEDPDLIYKLDDTFRDGQIKTDSGVFSYSGDVNGDNINLTIAVSGATLGITPLQDGGPGYIEFLPKE